MAVTELLWRNDSIKKLNRQMPKYKAHYFGKNLTKRQLCGIIA